MARIRAFQLVNALALATLAGALFTPLCSAADDGGSQPAVSEQAATAAPVQQEGAAPQMSGAAADVPAAGKGPQAAAPEAATQPPLTPMQAEIHQALETERTAVAALQARLAQAKDSAAAVEIQKQVQETKIQTQVSILQIQARYARAAGREAVAAQIETAIREMTAPKVPGKPIDRPAPPHSPAAGAQQH